MGCFLASAIQISEQTAVVCSVYYTLKKARHIFPLNIVQRYSRSDGVNLSIPIRADLNKARYCPDLLQDISK